MRTNYKKLGVIVVGLTLAVSAAGCKKKVAAAPPAPAPVKPVEPPPPPPPKALPVRIDTFVAEPATINQGQSSTLRWVVANATNITINQNIGTVPANGNRQVFPANSTTYTLTAGGPGGNESRAVTVTVNATPPPPPPPKPEGPKLTGIDILNREARDAYFDYDSSDIRDDARTALTANADVLKRAFAADPNLTVVLEGHCDERGSAEYNLGLGDRRATSAKDFLVQLGVPASKIRSISYGKDRPVCTDPNEDCYQRNRRAHLAPAQ